MKKSSLKKFSSYKDLDKYLKESCFYGLWWEIKELGKKDVNINNENILYWWNSKNKNVHPDKADGTKTIYILLMYLKKFFKEC